MNLLFWYSWGEDQIGTKCYRSNMSAICAHIVGSKRYNNYLNVFMYFV